MKTHLIYFSPTGTTKAVVESIAEGIGADTEAYDLTPSGTEISAKISGGIAVIGIPVYAGRVPLVCIERMKDIISDGTPAVIVVTYGNRAYEDALVELRDITSAAGFKVIAGAAFIGEHSYSTDEKPIAKNRPDAEDKAKAIEFGKAVKLKMNDLTTPAMSGNVPYKERMGMKNVAPVTDDAICNACGVCVKACPTDAIKLSPKAVSIPENCILCCACIKKCPSKARRMDNPVLQERAEMLFTKFSARKEPELFI